MKGIILAGGAGTRLYPLTLAVSKQLMPVYDKPMIYYPLSTLMLAGIRDMLIISTPHDLPLFHRLLGDGARWGLSLSYAEQSAPNGLAEAFIIGREFIGADNVALILGDNLFASEGLTRKLHVAVERERGATVFCYRVKDPERYGVIHFDQDWRIIGLDEKPDDPQSDFAITGLYFYDNRVADMAHDLSPSKRGELEITDINRRYFSMGELYAETLGRGTAWLDTGTHEALLLAAQYVQVMEERQGLKIGCPEEIAWRMGYIDDARFQSLAEGLKKSGYGEYLLALLEEGR